MNKQPITRCINIDWLEVYALEPINSQHDAEYYRESKYWVKERDYGTRVYSEMFTVMDEQGDPFLEIRRNPKSVIGQGGILPINATHLRLVNRACYAQNAVQALQNFMMRHNYDFRRIARIDLCLDFEMFDSGDAPQDFIKRYLKGIYTKINQANISAHGRDNWEERQWDSLSWGSKKSMIGTKLYCKTLELKENKDKPYIKQAWLACALIDNPLTCEKYHADGTVTTPQIWRLEFSIQSGRNGWFTIEENGHERNYHSYHNDLEQYTTKERQLAIFSSLVQHYFHFKYYEPNKRKDKCKDKNLFDFKYNVYYKIDALATAHQPISHELSLLKKLREYCTYTTDTELRHAAHLIIAALESSDLGRYCANPFSKAEILALQLLIDSRRKGTQSNVDVLKEIITNEIKAGTPPF